MIFDSHAHYNDDAFNEDRYELLSTMKDRNVGMIINAAASLSEMDLILDICNRYDFVYASVGIHPEFATRPNEEITNKIKEYAKYKKILAIGEIGLDYHYEEIPRDIQKECFDFQMSLAEELQMPVIIHDREAHRDTLDIVSRHRKTNGVFHCYSGSAEMVKEVLSLDYFIAFGGSLTFKNNVKTIEAARVVPLDKIVVETDCPYLSPVPNRGKRNQSDNIKFVLEKLSEIKDISVSELEKITFENAKRLFRLG